MIAPGDISVKRGSALKRAVPLPPIANLAQPVLTESALPVEKMPTAAMASSVSMGSVNRAIVGRVTSVREG